MVANHTYINFKKTFIGVSACLVDWAELNKISKERKLLYYGNLFEDNTVNVYAIFAYVVPDYYCIKIH